MLFKKVKSIKKRRRRIITPACLVMVTGRDARLMNLLVVSTLQPSKRMCQCILFVYMIFYPPMGRLSACLILTGLDKPNMEGPSDTVLDSDSKTNKIKPFIISCYPTFIIFFFHLVSSCLGISFTVHTTSILNW